MGSAQDAAYSEFSRGIRMFGGHGDTSQCSAAECSAQQHLVKSQRGKRTSQLGDVISWISIQEGVVC